MSEMSLALPGPADLLEWLGTGAFADCALVSFFANSPLPLLVAAALAGVAGGWGTEREIFMASDGA